MLCKWEMKVANPVLLINEKKKIAVCNVDQAGPKQL